MPTRSVKLDVGVPGPGGSIVSLPADAVLSLRPHTLVTVGDRLVLPEAFRAQPGDVVPLEVTEGWAWELRITSSQRSYDPRYFAVPAGSEVLLKDLPWVDPRTLGAVQPEAAWWAAVSQVVYLTADADDEGVAVIHYPTFFQDPADELILRLPVLEEG